MQCCTNQSQEGRTFLSKMRKRIAQEMGFVSKADEMFSSTILSNHLQYGILKYRIQAEAQLCSLPCDLTFAADSYLILPFLVLA